MMTYRLNGQPVPCPLGMDGLTLRKARHKLYWGFVYRRLGFVEGLSNLQFVDPDAVTVLRSALERDGLAAETSFRIEEAGTVLYDGFVDYRTYSDSGDSISVALRDDRAIVDLESNAAVAYALTPADTVKLHARRLGSAADLVIDPVLKMVQRSSLAASSLSHAVPLKRKDDKASLANGTLLDVKAPTTLEPIYRNETGKPQLVSVSGVVVATVSSSSALSLSLSVQTGEQVPIEQFRTTVGPTPQTITAAVNYRLTVAPGQDILLRWFAVDSVSRWSFNYDLTKTAISLTDETAVSSSTGYALTVESAFTELVRQATGGALSFRSTWCRTGDGYGLLLSNGYGVRGVQQDLSISIQRLFENLNKGVNLSLWVENGVVRLEPKVKAPRRLTYVTRVLKRVEKLAMDYVYNAVQVGYQTWQPQTGTVLTADEPNGQRSYSTNVGAVKNELNLISELVTASGFVETQRRRQFDPKVTADAVDDTLFLIAAVGGGNSWQAETTERAEYVTGNYETGTLYNLRFTPRRNLERWLDWLAASAPLTLQTVQGSAELTATVDGLLLSEADTAIGGRADRVPRLVTIELVLSMDDYALLGDRIDYQYMGADYEGELLEAVYRRNMTTLTLLER